MATFIIILGVVLIIMGILVYMRKLDKFAQIGISKANQERMDMEKYYKIDGIATFFCGVLFTVGGIMANDGYANGRWFILAGAVVLVAAMLYAGVACQKK